MSAKNDLFERLKYLDFAVSLGDLVDVGIAASDHNGRANLLRKGLGIIGFNLLEDFIKNRTVEALAFVSGAGISFDNLPDKLKTASTLRALEILHSRAKMERRAGGDWLRLIQAESQRIYSTCNHTYELSTVSLAPSGSNVTSEDVAEVLLSFGIQGGWSALKAISDQFGGGLPDLSQTYQNLASRRHSAAHSAGFSYSHAWLLSMPDEIMAIAASFDIALTTKLRMASKSPGVAVQVHDISTSIRFVFLEEASGAFRETRLIGGRSRKNWPTLAAATTYHKPRLLAENAFLIVVGTDRRVRDWHT